MMQKTEEDIIKDKKNLYFDKINSMIDYFAEFGVSPKEMTKDFFFESEIDGFNQKIRCELISKFPQYDKKRLCIDEAIISHIFPKNFEAVRATQKPPSKSFSIILDNQFYSAVFTNKYISCLLFYESRFDYQIAFIHSQLLKEENQNPKKQKELNEKLSEIESLKSKTTVHQIFIPKCICLVSVHPYLDYFSEILKTIYEISLKPSNILLDKVIEKLIIETVDPPRGIVKYVLQLLNKTIHLEQRKMNELPLVNFDFSFIFNTFTFDKVLDIFRYVLFEKKIIFMSEDITKLSTAIMGFTSLLLPFKYQFQISSILPNDFFYLLDGVSPFIFGLNETYSNDFLEEHDLTITNTELIFVDLDKKDFIVIDQRNNKIPLPEFPKKAKGQLEAAVKRINLSKDSDVFVKLREEWFNFMLGVLEPYQRIFPSTLQTEIDTIEISSLMNKKELDSVSREKDFYLLLFDTQMFTEFLFQKMTPKDESDKLNVLFVEERILKRNKKKNSTVFLSSKRYDFNYDIKKIDIISPQLSNSDKEYFLNEKNLQRALLKGIKCNIVAGNRFTFSYPFFPSLLTQDLFDYNINNFSPDEEDLLGDVNKEFAKSVVGDVNDKGRMSKMENYVYLTWMILWGLTFSYTENREKEFRFRQLLQIIDKVREHEMDIFDLIFSALFKYGNEEMSLQLYYKLISLRQTPSWFIFNHVSSILSHNVNKLQQIKKTSPLQKKLRGQDDFTTNQFRRRTLRDENDSHILSEEVLFMAYDNCLYCEKPIDLYEQSRNFSKIPDNETGISWIKCPYCDTDVQLKLKFRFGLEIFNRNQEGIDKSSRIDEVMLHSPKIVKGFASSVKAEKETLNVETFKRDLKVLFWNSIWYFKLANLDVSFMLPYEAKKIDCISRNYRLVSFNQNLLDENESSIEFDFCKMKKTKYDETDLIKQTVNIVEVIPIEGMRETVLNVTESSFAKTFDDRSIISSINEDENSKTEGLDYKVYTQNLVSKKPFNGLISAKNVTDHHEDKIGDIDCRALGTLREDFVESNEGNAKADDTSDGDDN